MTEAYSPPAVVPSEPATRISYQTVPTVDMRSEALEEALRREVGLFPKHKPIVDRVLHLAANLEHGRKVSKASRATGTGLGWQDES